MLNVHFTGLALRSTAWLRACRRAAWLFLLWQACGCVSDPYGFAPQYVPRSDEQGYLKRAVEPSYEEVRRDPASYQQALVAWFGVVDEVQPRKGEPGAVRVSLRQHFHQDRHLCTDQFSSSCRVTISEREGGPFTVWLQLRPEDREGRNRVYSGSLLKVYGRAVPEYDERGGPILRGDYYRHWPRGTYVTTRRSVNMRR